MCVVPHCLLGLYYAIFILAHLRPVVKLVRSRQLFLTRVNLSNTLITAPTVITALAKTVAGAVTVDNEIWVNTPDLEVI